MRYISFTTGRYNKLEGECDSVGFHDMTPRTARRFANDLFLVREEVGIDVFASSRNFGLRGVLLIQTKIRRGRFFMYSCPKTRLTL